MRRGRPFVSVNNVEVEPVEEPADCGNKLHANCRMHTHTFCTWQNALCIYAWVCGRWVGWWPGSRLVRELLVVVLEITLLRTESELLHFAEPTTRPNVGRKTREVTLY